MSYQALARKWRPKNFANVIGQDTVLQALTHALDTGRLHHAYLLMGTRGVGKTTIGRILAKCFNCLQGVSSQPCGQCEQCKAIDQGNAVDLIEVDAASRTKVEDTRELLDNVQYRPASGRFKIYLIDEVHMLSRHSFNALLKTLEEPPEYIKFILATTDPQKLPITVVSRCLQFHLKALQPQHISQHLASILTQEGHVFEHEALQLLGDAADGSVRDALTLTDQIIAFGQGQVTTTGVQAMLGIPEPRAVQKLLEAIAQLDLPAALDWVEELRRISPDFAVLHRELAKAFHLLAKLKILPHNPPHHWQPLADSLTPAQIQSWYDMALKGLEDLPWAPSGVIGLEMTVLKMIAFSPKMLTSEQPQPLGATPQTPASSHHTGKITITAQVGDLELEQREIEGVAQVMRNEVPEPVAIENRVTTAMPPSELDRTKALLAHRQRLKGTSPTAPSSPPIQHKRPEATPSMAAESNEHEVPWQTNQQPALSPADTVDHKKKAIPAEIVHIAAIAPRVTIQTDNEWAEFVAQHPVGGLGQQILLNSVCVQHAEHTCLHLQDPALRHLLNHKSQQDLQQLLPQLGRLLYDENALPQRHSPKAIASRKAQQRYDQACANLAQDPNVAWIEQTFQAELKPESLQLREKTP